MRENMNINQVEKITGVSKRNIRFYEKEGSEPFLRVSAPS